MDSNFIFKGELSNYIVKEDFNEILEIFPNGKIKTINNVRSLVTC